MAVESKKEDASSEAEKESFQLPAHLCGAIGFAMLAVVLYWNNFDVAQAPAWGQQLFAPHVVPAPPAKKNEVVVQFCQA